MKKMFEFVSLMAVAVFSYWFASIQPLDGPVGKWIMSNIFLQTMWGALSFSLCLIFILICIRPFIKRA